MWYRALGQTVYHAPKSHTVWGPVIVSATKARCGVSTRRALYVESNAAGVARTGHRCCARCLR